MATNDYRLLKENADTSVSEVLVPVASQATAEAGTDDTALMTPLKTKQAIAVATHNATAKATPVDADEMPIADSAASYAPKKVTWANFKTTLKSYFDALYPSTSDARLSDSRVPTAAGLASVTDAATSKATPVDADEVPLADSAASFGLKKLTWANIKATIKTYFDGLYTPQTRTIAGVDLSANRTLADLGASSRRSYQTANFTAVAYGRYHTSGTGITITDPGTAVAGDIYDVVVASGSAVIGGLTYEASRFPVEREYNGTYWVTLAPVSSDAVTVKNNLSADSFVSGVPGLSVMDTSRVTIAANVVALPLRNDIEIAGTGPINSFTGGIKGAIYVLTNKTGATLVITHGASTIVCPAMLNMSVENNESVQVRCDGPTLYSVVGSAPGVFVLYDTTQTQSNSLTYVNSPTQITLPVGTYQVETNCGVNTASTTAGFGCRFSTNLASPHNVLMEQIAVALGTAYSVMGTPTVTLRISNNPYSSLATAGGSASASNQYSIGRTVGILQVIGSSVTFGFAVGQTGTADAANPATLMNGCLAIFRRIPGM